MTQAARWGERRGEERRRIERRLVGLEGDRHTHKQTRRDEMR
jgi:hypothetical protein